LTAARGAASVRPPKIEVPWRRELVRVKRTTLLPALAALGAIAFASTAEAHFLTFKEARNATFNIAREDCEKRRTCDRFAAGPCTRVNAHKVKCRETLFGQNARGPYEIRIDVTVLIRPGSDKRFYRQKHERCEGPGCR
jgi:hypothetical protein